MPRIAPYQEIMKMLRDGIGRFVRCLIQPGFGKETTLANNLLRLHERYQAAGLMLLVAALLVPSESFSQLAIGRSKFLGNAVTWGYSIPSNFITYWNQVTPGNDGKWGSVESVQGTYNWSGLDALYNFALTNGIPFKDHNLVWGQQQPGWISSLDSAAQRAAIKAWIDTVGHRFPQMDFIDVVNEPLRAPPDGRNGTANYIRALGGSGATGWDWIVTAFTWARQACAPGVKLLINEYNVLQDNGVASTYIALIDTLKARGLIDGIGIQGHYFEFKSAQGLTPVYSYPVSTLKYNLDRLASATGLPIYISEFDINEPDDSTQLANYKIYFPLFWESPAVKGMTLWGYNEGDTWKVNAYLVRRDGSERPALQWLRRYLAYYLLQPGLVSLIGTNGGPRNPLMIWHPSVAASSYRLQIGTDDLFRNLVVDSTAADTMLRVSPLDANTRYYWHVCAMNASDTGDFSAPVSITTGDTVETGINTFGEIPHSFVLYQNFPNPFNPTTNIKYQIADFGFVSLKVYDILGREVEMLVNERQAPGSYSVNFNAAGLPSGVYFYRIDVVGESRKSFSSAKKLVLVK